MYLLSRTQQNALNYFREISRNKSDTVQASLNHLKKMCHLSERQYKSAIENLANYARIAIHFHPDRLANNNKLVAQSILEDGKYKSQFETGISNGSVSAHQGGDRDNWEKQLYNSAFHKNDFDKTERAKYGALDIFKHMDGPAPRFGSCYFVLKKELLDRSTFTYQDSHTLPECRGTWDEFDTIFCELLTDLFVNKLALGERDMSIPQFFDWLETGITKERDALRIRRNLNNYIEAQIHGEILLRRDIECLVVDSSFKNCEVGEILRNISEDYNFPLQWGIKRELSVEETPTDFRGPTMPSLAKIVSSDSKTFNTKSIGDAVRELKMIPEKWDQRGTYSENLQELKLLWHVLVEYGLHE
jgi:hypothetical protein